MASMRRSVVANYLGQGWAALMAVAFLPVYIRALGIEAYGLVGVLAFMQSSFTFLDLGLTSSINREMARYTSGQRSPQSTANLLKTVQAAGFVMATGIALTLWVAADWIAIHWLRPAGVSQEVVARAMSFIGILVAFRFVEGLSRGAILGLQHHVWLNVITIISATCRWAGAALIVLWRPDLDMFFGWQALVSGLTVAALNLHVAHAMSTRVRSASLSASELHGVWRYAGGTMAATLLTIGVTQADKLILSRMLSLEMFGYYTAAWTVAATLYQLIMPLHQSYFPRFTALSSMGQDESLRLAFHQAAQLLTWVILPPALMLVFFGDIVLDIWMRDPRLTGIAAPLVAIFSVGVLINGFLHVPQALALAAGWTRFAVIINAAAIVIFLPALTLAADRFGAVGAASAWLALNVSYLFIGMRFFFLRLLRDEKWSWYVHDIGIPTLAGVAVAATLWWLTRGGGVTLPFLVLAYSAITIAVGAAIPWLTDALRSFVSRKT